MDKITDNKIHSWAQLELSDGRKRKLESVLSVQCNQLVLQQCPTLRQNSSVTGP